MFDSIIQLKHSLVELDRRILILGWLYQWVLIRITKHKIHKIKNLPVSANLILGFYKFAFDTETYMSEINKYTLFYNPSNERDWIRTLMISNKEVFESITLSVHNGNMITVQYSNASISYDITVEENLLNFEYTPDRDKVLTRSNFIFMDCMMNYIDSYLDLKGR